MNRRKFNKTLATSVLGTATLQNFAGTIINSNNKIRLGGPVFKKTASPEEWVSVLKKLKFSAAYCPVKTGADSVEIKSYKDAALKADIIIAEVGAWSNPIDPDENKAKAAIEKNIVSLQLADEIGANCCVNISGSRNPEKWAGPHKDNLTDDTFDFIVETTRKIIDSVKPKNTFYTLETMPWSYPNSVESYEKLVKAIDRKQFAVHFDPVNLVTGVEVYYNNGAMIKDAFKRLGKFIRSCHAKDILLLEDKLTPHLPEVLPGLGQLNYTVFLKELSKLDNVPLMMEHLKSQDEYQKAAKFIRSVGIKNNIQFCS